MNLDRHATPIGLLYNPGDLFGERRAELMVGPMLMGGLQPVKFVSDQIDADTLTVAGQWFKDGSWQPCANAIISCILDFSIPNQTRTTAEALLLQQTPHSHRIDLNRWQLFHLLQHDDEVNCLVLPCRPLDSQKDVEVAVHQWPAFVVKSRFEGSPDQPYLIEKYPDGWKITNFYQETCVDDSTFQSWLSSKYNGKWMLQAFLSTRSAQSRPYALQITVQQRHDGAWMAPTIQCMLATESPFACLQAGAEHIGPPFAPIWENVVIPTDHPNYPGLAPRLQCFGLVLARRIEELSGGQPMALGFRVLLDKELNPYLVNLDVRAAAPTRAARNMEFFRHMTEFAFGLTVIRAKNIPGPKCLFDAVNPISQCPSCGISVRSNIKPEEVVTLMRNQSGWIDLAVGMGGRRTLRAANELAEEVSQRAFISLRIGVAANDIALPDLGEKRLSAQEEYVGKGLLRWPEVRLMRSARVPLLQAQLHHALQLMPARGPDMIWVEDMDLGMRALPEAERLAELKKTMTWLDSVCLQGWAGCWGVCLFNDKSVESQVLLEQMLAHSSGQGFFKKIGVRAANFNTKQWEKMSAQLPELVLLANNSTEHQWVTQNLPQIPVLTKWSPESAALSNLSQAIATC
ncbi:YheC/YheD family protein [Rhodoferax sp.]|uniref:YheC/YheD family protein n=1 Tax=Rhodoferax sp. TaxID=50421 RepID=UPI0008B3FD13|nr:YheC/YheD family protein [Rhodoferax sp.]MDO8317867.1 hypothetical protein [Rhodoferax sp.]OGB54461.1 MAG: hypothetical protein A2503_12440 [Burkholderiales bacterium RIFOXYD12_FULL_59_19]